MPATINLAVTCYFGVRRAALSRVLAERQARDAIWRCTRDDHGNLAWLETVCAFLLDEAARGAGTAAVECPPDTRPEEMIGLLQADNELAAAGIRIASITTVIDALTVAEDLAGAGGYFSPLGQDAQLVYTARSLLTALQIEYADHIVISGWKSLALEPLNQLLALIGHLAPTARLRLHGVPIPGTPLPVSLALRPEERPGWIRMLNDEFAPHMNHHRVTGIRYRNLRPFHPHRLVRTLERAVETGRYGQIIRSCGLCQFATRPGWSARWQHAGDAISFEPLPPDPDGPVTVGQDLALFGLDLDEPGLSEAFDACVLRDDEFQAGPPSWVRMPDPLPEWELPMTGR